MKGYEWVLLYNHKMYGNYLVPKKILDGPILQQIIISNFGIVVPNSILFVCNFIEKEKIIVSGLTTFHFV